MLDTCATCAYDVGNASKSAHTALTMYNVYNADEIEGWEHGWDVLDEQDMRNIERMYTPSAVDVWYTDRVVGIRPCAACGGYVNEQQAICGQCGYEQRGE